MAINNRSILGKPNPYDDGAQSNYVDGCHDSGRSSMIGKTTDQGSVEDADRTEAYRYIGQVQRLSGIPADADGSTSAGGVAVGNPDDLVTRAEGADGLDNSAYGKDVG